MKERNRVDSSFLTDGSKRNERRAFNMALALKIDSNRDNFLHVWITYEEEAHRNILTVTYIPKESMRPHVGEVTFKCEESGVMEAFFLMHARKHGESILSHGRAKRKITKIIWNHRDNPCREELGECFYDIAAVGKAPDTRWEVVQTEKIGEAYRVWTFGSSEEAVKFVDSICCENDLLLHKIGE